jgi:hypothetical protein
MWMQQFRQPLHQACEHPHESMLVEIHIALILKVWGILQRHQVVALSQLALHQILTAKEPWLDASIQICSQWTRYKI